MEPANHLYEDVYKPRGQNFEHQLKTMGSLFILIWTENAPPLSVQIKIKRDLTLGNVSFYLNLDRHQYLAQSRVYQCAKTSKSRILNLILVKYNILTIKAMFFYNFLLYFEAFLSKF